MFWDEDKYANLSTCLGWATPCEVVIADVAPGTFLCDNYRQALDMIADLELCLASFKDRGGL